jgi:hypothetical protein
MNTVPRPAKRRRDIDLLMPILHNNRIRLQTLPMLHSPEVCFRPGHRSNIQDRAVNKLDAYGTRINQRGFRVICLKGFRVPIARR